MKIPFSFVALTILVSMIGIVHTADAQAFDKMYAKSLILAGNQSDATNTITLLAPTLSPLSPYSLTLPIGNASGLLSNNGSGTLSWVAGMTNPMTTLGDIVYENSTPAPARLVGNTTTTNKFLTQAGNGSVSAAPQWSTIQASDLSNISSAAASVAVLGRSTADISTTSTSFVNAGGYSLAMAANEVWAFEFDINVNGAAGSGMNFQITVPSGATFNASAMGIFSSNSNFKCDRITTATPATDAGKPYGKTSDDGPVRITGVVVNGSTAGNIQLQYESSSGGSVTIFAGSYGIAHRF